MLTRCVPAVLAVLLAACAPEDQALTTAQKAQLIAQRVEELTRLAAERGAKETEIYFKEVCGLPRLEWDMPQIENWSKECAGHITQRLGQEMVKNTKGVSN